MELVKNILIVIYAVVCLALIILVMKQSKDDAGASSAVVGGQNSFYEKNKGRTKEGLMKRGTIILGVVFIILTVALSIVYAM